MRAGTNAGGWREGRLLVVRQVQGPPDFHLDPPLYTAKHRELADQLKHLVAHDLRLLLRNAAVQHGEREVVELEVHFLQKCGARARDTDARCARASPGTGLRIHELSTARRSRLQLKVLESLLQLREA